MTALHRISEIPKSHSGIPDPLQRGAQIVSYIMPADRAAGEPRLDTRPNKVRSGVMRLAWTTKRGDVPRHASRRRGAQPGPPFTETIVLERQRFLESSAIVDGVLRSRTLTFLLCLYVSGPSQILAKVMYLDTVTKKSEL